jgi:hypothetical protein
LRQLLHTPDIHLFNFAQADAYARRVSYLNKLTLPRGGLDLGKDIPETDTQLIGPTVELIAREACIRPCPTCCWKPRAKCMASRGCSRKRESFRFWLSMKSASARMPSVTTPPAKPAVPYLPLLAGRAGGPRPGGHPAAGAVADTGTESGPAIYRWRIQSGINRWYRVLFDIEREAVAQRTVPGKQEELLRRLAHVDATVSKIVVPAAFGDLLYELRGHIDFVRSRLQADADAQGHQDHRA